MDRVLMISSHIQDQIIVQKYGRTTFAKLNRPQALNTLTLEMIRCMQCLANQSPQLLIFHGQGRAFCAGGQVASIAKQETDSFQFFRSQYSLFLHISSLPTLTVAILDGISMGGGLGLSQACKIRVATQRTLWAMPQTAIGFFPDVGSSYYLTRISPIELGVYLGLTGGRLNGTDCYFFGIVQYFILTENIPFVLQELKSGYFQEVLRKYHQEPRREDSQMLGDLDKIRAVFRIDSGGVEEIVERLREMGGQWAEKVLEVILSMCPQSLKVTLEELQRGQNLDYVSCMEMEINLVAKLFSQRPNSFDLGVSHKLLQKKKGRPEWSPGLLEEVTRDKVLSYFNYKGPKLVIGLNVQRIISFTQK